LYSVSTHVFTDCHLMSEKSISDFTRVSFSSKGKMY
jgi:hypothetical protein